MMQDKLSRSGRYKFSKQLDPLACILFVYLGVVLSASLPVGLLALMSPLALPSAVISPLAALPIAFIVYDHRASKRWRTTFRAPMSHRALNALSDGVQWLRWIRGGNVP